MHTVDTSELYADHPHLARIDRLWGTRRCRKLIHSLLHESRDGTRRGFPPHHAATILKLLVEHDEQFPEMDSSGPNDAWMQERGRIREW